MPTYEYHCDACGAEFELFQSIKAKPISKCPTCGRRRVRRLIGIGAGVIFKGSGFYSTQAARSPRGSPSPKLINPRPRTRRPSETARQSLRSRQRIPPACNILGRGGFNYLSRRPGCSGRPPFAVPH